MVGVSNSKGCRMCVNRRIKCDETRPQCLRCIKRGCECPGYNRHFKFRDQTQALQQRYRREPLGCPSRTPPRVQRQEQTQPAELSELIIDEVFAPGLTFAALDIQTKERFNDFLDYYFPAYSIWSSLLEVNWMDFVRQQGLTCPQALIWAIRALNTFHMGVVRGDKGVIACGRHMYGRGIKHLAYILQTPAALTDETLAAAILLGGYEMLDESCKNSWVLHCGGIRYLICARGPAAHKHGIGRTLLLSFRNFLVTEAFRQGGPCFLEKPEWSLTANESSGMENERNGYDLVDHATEFIFNEIVRCPGYYAATSTIIESQANIKPADIGQLIRKMTGAKSRLTWLHTRIGFASNGDTTTTSLGSSTAMTLSEYAKIVAEQPCISILSSVLALLDQLMTVLELHQNSRSRLEFQSEDDCVQTNHQSRDSSTDLALRVKMQEGLNKFSAAMAVPSIRGVAIQSVEEV
ncbi:hypothetical protein ABOM_000185 [Aspergillus bombycis]|uniref:Zn(2)-C6 fungal-type domain-containing protein n=1 Tax=Aspergillus bombycis TaxID=109264 RepID=A0A1F8AHU3_9EURO|nr:hypothetical protein ABOM_000185 [Aspergillus bombycis]OGM51296.1 hypothetical protein ABOM_000185 [Aspergillus bombycis]